MLSNLIVASVLIVVIGLAFYKTAKDLKNNKCSCGSSCSDKSKCHLVEFK